ncbi:hypothetical protein Trisim1_001785 [Trichoderma cf. simile WF8]
MALNSQFSASIWSAKNENTLGFINANVDFALIKVEVPKQFEGLGKALSHHRRQNAESGPQHRMARRLGALFEQVIPNIDALAAAYGERVSEIATSSRFDLKDADHGPFAGHVGVDGTSIYAAASSGKSIIALHLLACMLARMFSSAEATAIWVQLVDCRLREIEQASEASQLQGLAALYAAEQGRQILRDDLASWDASARAWLQTANEVKKLEDTQLKLIARNILSIHNSGTTYSNVIENWIVAMTTIQNLIRGVPQDVTNGSVILGLMSWHIYPDLNVFSPNRYIPFHDRLVKVGGVITLGLEAKEKNGSGVSWSVSLSHLRFYGDPVLIEKSSEEDSDRVTVQELGYIILGCVLASWTQPALIKIEEAAGCFAALGDAIEHYGSPPDEKGYNTSMGWITPLIDTARSFLSTINKERETALYFIEFGRRRGRNFLDDEFRNILPMFGLLNPYLLFRLSLGFSAQCHDLEGSIVTLRRLAQDIHLHRDDCIIVTQPRALRKGALMTEREDSFESNLEFVSAVPVAEQGKKRSYGGDPRVIQRHTRWVHIDRTKDPLEQRYLDLSENVNIEAYPDSGTWGYKGLHQETLDETSIAAIQSCDCIEGFCRPPCSCYEQGFRCTSMCACVSDFAGIEQSLRCQNIRTCSPALGPVGEDCFWLSVRSTLHISSSSILTSRGSELRWVDPPSAYVDRQSSALKEASPSISCDIADEQYRQFIHLPNEELEYLDDSPYCVNAIGRTVKFQSVEVNGIAGLFLRHSAKVDVPTFTFSRLTAILRSGDLDPSLLRNYLMTVPETGIIDYSTSLVGEYRYSDLFFRSLKAVSAISDLYSDWSGATISISITKRPIGCAYWASNIWKQTGIGKGKFWRATKFSCLAMLESGGCDIHPDQVELVMAMATGNSIYTSEALLQDPILQDHSGESAFKGIRRIHGNLGYPGIVMLIPPPTPRILQVDPTRGRFVQAASFDGRPGNSFTETSLHLKLTDYKFPLASARGAVDADVVMREALISVYDGSRWVADLDIVRALQSQGLALFMGCSCAKQNDDRGLCQLLADKYGDQLKVITTWEELLLCQENLMAGELGIVRVYGNWFARLAATTVAIQLRYPTVALPSHCICSRCGKHLLEQSRWISSVTHSESPALLII